VAGSRPSSPVEAEMAVVGQAHQRRGPARHGPGLDKPSPWVISGGPRNGGVGGVGLATASPAAAPAAVGVRGIVGAGSLDLLLVLGAGDV
jgi:hypothetical protein